LRKGRNQQGQTHYHKTTDRSPAGLARIQTLEGDDDWEHEEEYALGDFRNEVLNLL
jgi:hypothetical protein